MRIRSEIARLLGGLRGLRILDVGCGAGVLTSELCHYGDVVGTDLSGPAIELAACMEPRASFVAGRFQELELGIGFDVITLFDVVEHVPTRERADLFARLDSMLSSTGCLVLTTPHPAYTQWVRKHEPQLLQIVDEAVEPSAIAALVAIHDLDLLEYRVYDVDRPGMRQYQLFAFGRRGPDTLLLSQRGLMRRLSAQLRSLTVPPLPSTRRLAQVTRLLRAGRRDSASWLLGLRASAPTQSEW
jgi:SAM-dependent methyltransferase